MGTETGYYYQTTPYWTSCSVGGDGYNTASILAIKSDGTLWGWGRGDSGQLGQGGIINRSSPTQIGLLTNWATATISVTDHSIARKTDGTIWTWGNATAGALGDNTVVNKSSPVQVGTATDWASVSANYSQANLSANCFALKTNGTLWAWGAAVFSVGGTPISRSSPVQIGTETNWSSISAGHLSGYGIKTNGTLWAWGQNTYGELGQNNSVTSSSPVQVGTGTNWLSVRAKCGAAATPAYGTTVLAIKTDGSMWSWGYNSYGCLMLSIIDTAARSSPTQVGTGTNWLAVKAGNGTSFAIRGP